MSERGTGKQEAMRAAYKWRRASDASSLQPTLAVAQSALATCAPPTVTLALPLLSCSWSLVPRTHVRDLEYPRCSCLLPLSLENSRVSQSFLLLLLPIASTVPEPLSVGGDDDTCT